MIQSILALWCGRLFLFFYNLCVRLDIDFATGCWMAFRKEAAIQENYRQAMAKGR